MKWKFRILWTAESITQYCDPDSKLHNLFFFLNFIWTLKLITVYSRTKIITTSLHENMKYRQIWYLLMNLSPQLKYARRSSIRQPYYITPIDFITLLIFLTYRSENTGRTTNRLVAGSLSSRVRSAAVAAARTGQSRLIVGLEPVSPDGRIWPETDAQSRSGWDDRSRCHGAAICAD